MDYLDTRRFDGLSDGDVLDRIGALLAIAIGRREQQQRQLTESVSTSQGASVRDSDLAALDLTQLVTDPLEAWIIRHLRAAGSTNAREVATSLGVTTAVAAQKLARLCAAGLCRVDGRSRPACYRLRVEFSAN